MKKSGLSTKYKASGVYGPPPPGAQREFGATQLQAMHRYCLAYRDLVRGGGKPTNDQDEKFTVFQKVCYREGVAYADH